MDILMAMWQNKCVPGRLNGKTEKHLWRWRLTHRVCHTLSKSGCSQIFLLHYNLEDAWQGCQVSAQTFSTVITTVGQIIALAIRVKLTKLGRSKKSIPRLAKTQDRWQNEDSSTTKICLLRWMYSIYATSAAELDIIVGDWQWLYFTIFFDLMNTHAQLQDATTDKQ